MRGEMDDRILDATERMLARFGYQKMTMEDIAREAGVGRRTIYLHFPGKEEVALCSIDRIVDRLLERLYAIAASERPAEEKVREMLRTRVLYRFDSVHDYYQSFNDLFAALRPAYMARRECYFDSEAAAFAGVLEAGRQSGTFALDDPQAAARSLLTATNALLPYSLSARELGAREAVEAQVEGIAALLLDGLRRRDPAGF